MRIFRVRLYDLSYSIFTFSWNVGVKSSYIACNRKAVSWPINKNIMENKIDPRKDPNCFLCKEDEIMNVHHLLWKCPYTGNLRFKSFERIAVEESTAIAGANYNYKISAKQLACFLKGLKELDFNWLEIAENNETNEMPSDGSP